MKSIFLITSLVTILCLPINSYAQTSEDLNTCLGGVEKIVSNFDNEAVKMEFKGEVYGRFLIRGITEKPNSVEARVSNINDVMACNKVGVTTEDVNFYIKLGHGYYNESYTEDLSDCAAGMFFAAYNAVENEEHASSIVEKLSAILGKRVAHLYRVYNFDKLQTLRNEKANKNIAEIVNQEVQNMLSEIIDAAEVKTKQNYSLPLKEANRKASHDLNICDWYSIPASSFLSGISARF